MLQDDYKRVMEYFQQTIEGKPLDLKDLCKESLGFFQKIQQTVLSGNDTEREEALEIMSTMYQTLMGESQKLKENSGLSEEQLASFAENSSNFEPEQWKMIQETRETMSKTGDSLAAYIRETRGGEPEAKPEKKPEAKKKKRISKPKRDDWLRS